MNHFFPNLSVSCIIRLCLTWIQNNYQHNQPGDDNQRHHPYQTFHFLHLSLGQFAVFSTGAPTSRSSCKEIGLALHTASNNWPQSKVPCNPQHHLQVKKYIYIGLRLFDFLEYAVFKLFIERQLSVSIIFVYIAVIRVCDNTYWGNLVIHMLSVVPHFPVSKMHSTRLTSKSLSWTKKI